MCEDDRHLIALLQISYEARHSFAVRLYQATHDVYQVKQALGNANVGVTETYLRSLGLEG